MGFGFRVSGFGVRVSGFGFGFRVSSFGFRGSGFVDFEFRVSGFGFWFARPESCLGVGFGFRVWSVETSSPEVSLDHVSNKVAMLGYPRTGEDVTCDYLAMLQL